MIRPTPASSAARDLRVRLVVAVQADVARRGPRAQRDRELAARARCRRAGPPRAPSARPRRTGTPCPRSTRRRRRRSRRTPSRTRAGSRGHGRAGRPRRGRRRGCRARRRARGRRRRPTRHGAVGAPGRPRRPGLAGDRGHMRSGADTPSSPSPLARTWRVASFSHRRVRCTSVTASSPNGATRRWSYQRVVAARRAPRGSGRRGAARAARRPGRRRAGTPARRAEQRRLALVVEQRRRRSRPRDAPRPRPRCGATRARAGVRVLHVEDGVLVAAPGQQVEVEVDAGVRRRARQRVAGGVDADGLDQVVDGDDGARPLAHPDRLAVLDQVDHLADEDLEVHARGVAERRARSPSCGRCTRGGRRRA